MPFQPRCGDTQIESLGDECRVIDVGVAGRVLVADDDPSVTSTQALILREAGYSVEVAATGRQCVHAIHAGNIDLLLLDMRFGDTDGITLLKRLRRVGVLMPVVITTGFGDIETAVRAMKAGATDFIAKPVFEEELVNLVARNLHGCVVSQHHSTLGGRRQSTQPDVGVIVRLQRKIQAILDECTQNRARCFETAETEVLGLVCCALSDDTLSLPDFIVCAEALRRLLSPSDIPLVRHRLMEAMDALSARQQIFRSPLDSRIRHMTDALLTGASKDLTCSEAAWGARLGVDRTRIGRRLREESGSDFRSWRRACRLKRAILLLLRTQEQSSQIAFAVGYGLDQVAQFCREFRGFFGVSPRTLRRLIATDVRPSG